MIHVTWILMHADLHSPARKPVRFRRNTRNQLVQRPTTKETRPGIPRIVATHARETPRRRSAFKCEQVIHAPRCEVLYTLALEQGTSLLVLS